MRYIGYTSEAKKIVKFSEDFLKRLEFVSKASEEEIKDLAPKRNK